MRLMLRKLRNLSSCFNKANFHRPAFASDLPKRQRGVANCFNAFPWQDPKRFLELARLKE
jgi:hypothetical protein